MTDYKEKEFIPVNIAVLTISDRRTLKDDESGDLLVDQLQSYGHKLQERNICKDNRYQIRSIRRYLVSFSWYLVSFTMSWFTRRIRSRGCF